MLPWYGIKKTPVLSIERRGFYLAISECKYKRRSGQIKQGAGAKTGTDGRTFYLWYDKESVLYKVPSTIIREDFNPNSLISQ